MEFVERTTAPSKDNKNYYSDINPFFPKYVDNCTWYCWGRQLELGVSKTALKKKLPTTNAENWYKDTLFEKGEIPKVGAIGCYSCGKRHHAADGMGHVFIVEKVYPDKSIDITESGTNMKFKKRHIKYPYNIYFKSKYKYTFDGFIYPQKYDEKFTEGLYITLKEKYARTSPEVKSGNKVKYNTIVERSLYKKDKLGYAKFKINDTLYLDEFTMDKKGNTWGKFGYYWLCVNDSTGDQVKKA